MGSRLMMVLAGVLAVGSLILLWYGTRLGREAPTVEQVVAENEPRAPAPPPEADVVAAARDLPRGHLLAADDLTVTRTEGSGTGHYLDPQPLVGEITRVPVAAGALLEPAHLVQGGLVARSLFPGERAVAVQADEVIGTGGFVQPEDYVDVLLYLKGRFEHVDQSQAQVVLRKVRVLALGDTVVEQPVADPPPDAVAEQPQEGVVEQAGSAVRNALPGDEPESAAARSDERAARTTRTPGGDDERNRNTGKRSRSAVLAVQEADASRLMLAASAGDLRLALLPTAEGAVAAAAPAEPQSAGLTQAALTREQARLAAEQEAARRRVVLDDLIGKQRRAASSGAGPRRGGAAEPAPTLVIHRGDEAERVAVGR